MDTRVNRQGLGRSIPSPVKREVRKRSKFGCVVCRSGFYEYEHIVPFAEVERHDPDHICCLCEDCHSRVTRGQWSKDFVRARYTEVQHRSVDEVGLPRGPLDFHTGTAVLAIGDLVYAPAVQSVLRYFGDDLIKVVPGRPGEPGLISAVFTDNEGKAILELDENEWVGSLEAWDIDVQGARITVREKQGVIALQLRLDPPGRIVVERLDMRLGAHHILASERCYAVGGHTQKGDVMWFSPRLTVTGAAQNAVAIELTKPQELLDRDRYFQATGQGVGGATADRQFIIHSPAGVMYPNFGISIASWCSFDLYGLSAGAHSLIAMREAVFASSAKELRQFLGEGQPIAPA